MIQPSKISSGLSIVSAIAEQSTQPGEVLTSVQSASRPASPKNIKTPPPILLRLKTTPIHYLLELTKNFNRTMLRLNSASPGRKRRPNPQDTTTKTPTRTPPNLFRIERTPTFCFL